MAGSINVVLANTFEEFVAAVKPERRDQVVAVFEAFEADPGASRDEVASQLGFDRGFVGGVSFALLVSKLAASTGPGRYVVRRTLSEVWPNPARCCGDCSVARALGVAK